METNEKVFDLLESTGLNWTVFKEPLVSETGLPTESFGIFRNDSKNWLGTVKSRYTILQNYEMAEIILKASEGLNIAVNRGGQLSAGGRIYLQAELPEEFIGKSKVKRWITALNSHDGSGAAAFGSTNVTVICRNTFYRAYGELEKFRHTSSMKDRIAIAQKDLRITMGFDNNLMDKFKIMADKPLKEEIVERVIRKIFKIEPDEPIKNLSTKKTNLIGSFASSIETSIEEQEATVWALFNGVTRYVNHVAAPSDPEKKKDYLFGTGSEISNVGFNEIMKYIEENTAKQFVVS